MDPEFLDTIWHTVAPTEIFWRMNELSLVSMGPSLWPVSQGREMALAQVRMGTTVPLRAPGSRPAETKDTRQT